MKFGAEDGEKAAKEAKQRTMAEKQAAEELINTAYNFSED